MTMNLRVLLDDPTVPDVEIADLTLDSRALKPGDAFLALPGGLQDGRRFVPEAFAQGAVAVLCEAEGGGVPTDDRIVMLPALRSKLGRLADRFYGSPSRAMTVIAATGTNGKTSVVDLGAQIIRQTRGAAGSIGTLGARLDQQARVASNTTPDCLSLHRQLSQWQVAGVEYVALEASSHALDQGRLDGVAVDVGVFTNLSRDHLDYHGSMQEYCDAKLRLFRDFRPAVRIYNADDPEVALHQDIWRHGGLGISDISGAADVTFEVLSTAPLLLRVSTPWGEGEVQTALAGRFNAFNVVTAISIAVSVGASLQDALTGAARLQPVEGRLQSVGDGEDIAVVIDYAHTPDALERALAALLESKKDGALWVVFGCGGDRDKGKRPEMGMVACRLADRVVVTSDNPRTEAPEQIVDDILRGCESGSPLVEVDRAAAIAMAISEAKRGDTVLIAGKGHEHYQEIQGVRLPFSDFQHAQENLSLRRAA